VHTDHQNTPRKVAQPGTGTLAWRWDADPFGTAAPNQNPAGLGTFAYNLRFPGQYYMAETGLNYNWNRDYDSATGKYIQSDPIGLRSGVNSYVYADGNPIIYRDPTGQCPWCIAGAVIGGLGNAYNNYAAYSSGQISGLQYFEDIVVGAGTGALSGIPGGGFVGAALLGGLTAGANERIQELVNGKVSDCKTALATGLGIGTAALFGPLGEAIGNRISRPVVGSLVTSPSGYPAQGALAGFIASSLIMATPIPDWVFPNL
jgi:RHS repeat-associated protein